MIFNNNNPRRRRKKERRKKKNGSSSSVQIIIFYISTIIEMPGVPKVHFIVFIGFNSQTINHKYMKRKTKKRACHQCNKFSVCIFLF